MKRRSILNRKAVNKSNAGKSQYRKSKKIKFQRDGYEIYKDKVQVYYNSSTEAFDPYTVVIGDSVFTMSSNADSPQGVNMYIGEIEDYNIEDFGIPIPLSEAPEGVQRGIKQRLVNISFKDKLIEEGFKIDEHGIIRTPGKFEGERYPVVYFYDLMMNDEAEEEYVWGDNTGFAVFTVTEDDIRELGPESDLQVGEKVGIEWTEEGFVYYLTGVTDEDIAQAKGYMGEYYEEE